MSKIPLLIFSMDRSSQLDLLIRSIERFAPARFEIAVLYNYSSKEYKLGYELLQVNECGDSITFFSEKDFDAEISFKGNTLKVMTYLKKMTNSEYLMFLTDDCLFFRASPIDDLLWVMNNNRDSVGVASLRLGLTNKIETYFTNSPTLPLSYTELTNDVIGWRHLDYPSNSCWGYQFSLDGNIFRLQELLPIVQDTNFNNPNDLEAGLSQKTHLLKPYVVSSRKQSLVASPVNSVSAYQNRAGDFHPMSTEFLNRNFLEGKRLDLDGAVRYAIEHVNCTHHEIKFNFVEE